MRNTNPTLTILVGPAASGKSTWAKTAVKLNSKCCIVSRDDYRWIHGRVLRRLEKEINRNNMPYITCPDGQTYSRYDNSTYVKWCKCQEDSIYRAKHIACMNDPVCKAKQEQIDKVGKVIIGGGLSCFFLLIVFFFVMLFKLKI